MTSASSFNSNKAATQRPPGTVHDAQSILNKQTTLEELYNHLARQSLTPDANTGKQRFYAVVTKVLSNESALTDLFLSSRHEIERINNLSDSESKAYKIVLLHVPDLFTYFNSFDEQQIKSPAKEGGGLTSLDLQKIPALTTKNVKVGQVVQIIFENTKTYTGPIILDVEKEKNQRLEGEKKKYESTREVMKNIVACKLLSKEDAEGYAASSNLTFNLKNPTDYLYTYTALTSLLESSNLIQRIILSNTTGELQEKYGGFVDDQTTSGYQKYFLENQDDFPFTNIKIYSSQKVVDFIKKTIGIQNASSYSPLIETNSQIVTDQRSIFVDLSGLKSQNLIIDIANYLEKITENNFKYSWELQSNNVYKMDIFGKSNISEKLKNGDVDDAIKYSTISVNKSYPSKDSNQRTSIYPAPETKSPASTSQNATAPTSSTTATITSGSLPNCEDQTKINNLLYNSVKDGKNFETLKVDNKRLKKITSEKGLDGWLTNIETYVMYDYDNQPSELPTTKEFNYSLNIEVISVEPENPKKKPTEQKKKKKKNEGRGTNANKIRENGKKLTEFVKGLSLFIARNEGLDTSQVVVFPISVFRKYVPVQPNSGIDKNSRHFFNRAIDFTVYINLNGNFKQSSKTIPTEGTYEIPNTIVYLYVAKYLATIGKGKLSICGLALLEKGKSRKTGYVHYEYMGDLTDPRDPNIQPLRRRWLSESTDTKTVYGQAFGRADAAKDKIIKNFVIKDTKNKVGALPTKIENLL